VVTTTAGGAYSNMKTKTNAISANKVRNTIPHHVVAERAYDIWIARGQPVGCDHENWAEAVRQLTVPIPEEEETLSSKMTHWDEPLGTGIESSLNSMTPTSGQRSATSL